METHKTPIEEFTETEIIAEPEEPEEEVNPVPDKQIDRSLVEATEIELIEKRPEDVKKTTMRKFCFRRVNQHIGFVYLKNKDGQCFTLEIDEATARKIAKCFDELDQE